MMESFIHEQNVTISVVDASHCLLLGRESVAGQLLLPSIRKRVDVMSDSCGVVKGVRSNKRKIVYS